MRMHNPQYALACSQPLAIGISHAALVFLEHSGHHAAGCVTADSRGHFLAQVRIHGDDGAAAAQTINESR